MSTAAIAVLSSAVPITIIVVAVCALAWKSISLSPEGQGHTLRLLDRLLRLVEAIWPWGGK